MCHFLSPFKRDQHKKGGVKVITLDFSLQNAGIKSLRHRLRSVLWESHFLWLINSSPCHAVPCPQQEATWSANPKGGTECDSQLSLRSWGSHWSTPHLTHRWHNGATSKCFLQATEIQEDISSPLDWSRSHEVPFMIVYSPPNCAAIFCEGYHI